MIKQQEHAIQERIVNYLRVKQCITICGDMPIAHMFLGKDIPKKVVFNNYIVKQGYTKGQSDLIAVNGGQVLFIEVKRWNIGKKGQAIGKTKQEPEQIEFENKIKANGLKYFLIDSPEKEQELYDLVNKM